MGEVLKDDIKVIAFSGGGRIGEKYVMKSDMVLEEFCGLFMYKSKPRAITLLANSPILM